MGQSRIVSDVLDRAARLLGVADVSDRAARLLGHVSVDGTVAVSQAANTPDVTDRAARLLGIVTQGLAPTGTVGSASGNINTARVTGTAVAASTLLVAAPAAGLSIYVTDIVAGNSGAALTVLSLLAAGGTNVYDLPCAANGGGATVNLQTPWKLPAATALNYLSSVATTYFLTINYFTGP